MRPPNPRSPWWPTPAAALAAFLCLATTGWSQESPAPSPAPTPATEQPSPAPDSAPKEQPDSPTAADYRRQAVEVMEHTQKEFYIRRSGLYMESLEKRHPAFIWPGGVWFSALVGAARQDPAWLPPMEKYFKAIEAYWDSKAKIPGYEPSPTPGNGNDKYYDDNAWLVLSFLEAYELTKDKRYLKRARETLDFVMSGWDDQAGGGIWWHEEHKDDAKNTCVNAPAAVACFRMSQFESKEATEWIAKGRQLVEWTDKTLRAPNGLFSDHIKVSTGRIRRGQLSYNQGLMIRAYLQLHQKTSDPAALAEARKIADAASALISSRTGAYRDSLKWSHLLVEADLELHRVTGDEKLLQRAIADTTWHFNKWKAEPPPDLITNASMARQLWLMSAHMASSEKTTGSQPAAE